MTSVPVPPVPPVSRGSTPHGLADVTARVRDQRGQETLAEQLTVTEDRYRTLFETLPQGVIYCAADGLIIEANPAASEILGVDADAMISWPLAPAWHAVHEDGSPCRPEEFPVTVALRSGEVVTDAVVGIPHGRTGEIRWLRITAVPDARDQDGRPQRAYAMFRDLTAQRRAERERAELLASEGAARAEAGNARERLMFLLRAGDLVAAARDRHELLQHAARLVVDSLADFCLVYLPAVDGSLRATSIAHGDRARGVVLADLRDHSAPMVGQLTVQAVYATGTSRLVLDAAARLADRDDIPPPLAGVLGRLQPDNVLVAPLTAGQRPLGVLALGRGPERPCFSETDIEVVEELGRRMAVGLANADTFARDHTIAETLQRAVLPDLLPKIAGLDLAVRYLPATDGVDIGGDWYDAFPLDGDRVGLVIGDVVGHNVAAASIMGQVRNLLRGYAIEDPRPADVLRRTNTALARLLPEALATVVYAVLDPAAGELSYANAGHPPPILTTGAGQAEYLDAAAGVMLGAPGDAVFTAARRHLPPGAEVLFYTDGLIEDRHRDITDGLDALAVAMRSSTAVSAEETCVAAQAMLPGSTPRADDVCLLAARLTG